VRRNSITQKSATRGQQCDETLAFGHKRGEEGRQNESCMCSPEQTRTKAWKMIGKNPHPHKMIDSDARARKANKTEARKEQGVC